jgi:hypothetical protein
MARARVPCVRPRRRSLLRLAGVLGLAAGLLARPALAAGPPTIAPEELRPGDRAVVRTVLRGDSIEDFPAEIVGVLSGGRVDGTLIVARALGERMQVMGVAQGMSGSPVYVGGRLAGALASSWTFEREPLFGITPIGDMLRLLDRAEPPADAVTAGPVGADLPLAVPDAGWGAFRWSDAAPPAAVPSPADPAAPTPLPIPLACTGFGPDALALTSARFAPLGFRVLAGGAAGTISPAAPDVVPGSSVAVDLMRGDAQVSAIGTVTWRDGDRVLLFGHTLFQAGDVRLPLSTASIVTVVASEYSSFKLGGRGREIGVVGQDRRSGAAGRLDQRARMLPMSVAIEGLRPTPQRFRFELVEDRALAPTLAAVATSNSLMESGGAAGNQTLAWTLRLHRPTGPPLTLSDVAAGDAPVADVAGGVNGPLAFLFGNPFTRLALDSIEIAVRAVPGRAQWTLRRARALRAAVRPGESVGIECVLDRWRGGTETRRLELRVPEELPAGTYRLWVGGGAELTRLDAARVPARYRPTSLEDAWQRFAALRHGNTLHAVLVVDGASVTTGGSDYDDLPASAAALLSGGSTTAEADQRSGSALVGEVRMPFPGVVRGELVVNLTVDPKAP